MSSYALETATDPFAQTRMMFEQEIGWLAGPDSAGLTHADLEAQVGARERPLGRRQGRVAR